MPLATARGIAYLRSTPPETGTPMARILVTSALPYINGVKHLGNLVGSQLPADVYARYMRARGHEVLFICATDEHGTPAELAAAAAGEPVADYCTRLWAVQKRSPTASASASTTSAARPRRRTTASPSTSPAASPTPA